MAPENAPTQQSGENTASKPPSWPTEQGEWVKMATEGTGFRGSAAPPKHEEVAAAVEAIEPPAEPGVTDAPEAAGPAPAEDGAATHPENGASAPPAATEEDDSRPAFLGRVTGSD